MADFLSDKKGTETEEQQNDGWIIDADEPGGSGIVAQAKRVFHIRERVETRAGTPQTALDGYVRRTPVQEIRIPEDYRSRMIKRVIAIVLGLTFAAVVLYLLIRFWSY